MSSVKDIMDKVGKDNKSQPNEKVKSLHWINVGAEFEIDGEKVFVSLPMGIAMDNIQPSDYRGNNEKWAAFIKAQNMLIEYIKGQLEENVDDNGIVDLPKLLIQGRKVKDKEEVVVKSQIVSPF